MSSLPGHSRHQPQVIARSCLDDKLRQRCLRLLSKICKANMIMPIRYTLPRELIHVGRFSCHGGSADVSDGEYIGHFVAIKRLKMDESNPGATFKVCMFDQPRAYATLSPPPRACVERSSIGNAMQYARYNPKANRLQLVSYCFPSFLLLIVNLAL